MYDRLNGVSYHLILMEPPLEIDDGFLQLKIPMRYNPLGYTFSYLLIDALTLIDTGVGAGRARIALDEQLKMVGLESSDIERIILTHLHRDHIGLVGYVKSTSDARVYAHEKAHEVLRGRASEKNRYDKAQNELQTLGGGNFLKILGRFEHAFKRRPTLICVDETVSDGDLLDLEGFKLRVIWTPGHAHEHICMYDSERKILFSGDHVLPRITSHISLHTSEDADPLADYLSSLEKLRELSVDLVLPSHEYTFKDLGNRIDELKHHHEKRCREILGALSRGEQTVFQISANISWDSDPWPRMRLWTKRMAASETLAHLVYLRNIGEVRERLGNGVLYYRLV